MIFGRDFWTIVDCAVVIIRACFYMYIRLMSAAIARWRNLAWFGHRLSRERLSIAAAVLAEYERSRKVEEHRRNEHAKLPIFRFFDQVPSQRNADDARKRAARVCHAQQDTRVLGRQILMV